jgi:hypothetical protein
MRLVLNQVLMDGFEDIQSPLMSDGLLQKFEMLVEEGTKLTPLGGFDFSGYNARMQYRYLAWRKACLESLEVVGPIGVPYKNKIIGDANGGFFYQASAYLALSSIRELFEKLKASPELAAEAVPAQSQQVQEQPLVTQSQPATGVRVLKPPPKLAGGPVPAPAVRLAPVAAAATAAPKSAYVVGEFNDPLRQQLAAFLDEIGVVEIPLDRIRGEMLALESIPDDPDARFAFFVFNTDDLTYAMFELGHFVGKLGRGHVVVLHMSDVAVPKNIPGVLTKPIVVKLEEASLSIMKELKGAGYVISI